MCCYPVFYLAVVACSVAAVCWSDGGSASLPAPSRITVVPGYVRVGDSPGYRCTAGRPEKGHHRRRPREHQARAGILFRLRRPSPRSDLWRPRGASLRARARLIARPSMRAVTLVVGEGSRRKRGKGGLVAPPAAGDTPLVCLLPVFFLVSSSSLGTALCLFVYQTAFLFTRWPPSQPPVDWITTARSLPPPPSSTLVAASIPLTCRGAQLFVSQPVAKERERWPREAPWQAFYF